MSNSESKSPRPQVVRPDRRRLLSTASKVAMTAGLAGGYGAFGLIAGRFLYPARPRAMQWQFVAEAESLALGDSIVYRAGSGETISITRQGDRGDATDFIALSSVCPHLGCQVYWEAQNNRYFCPCHNGTFDPSGVATGGPPGDAGQTLPRYDLKIGRGLLYIEVPATHLVSADSGGEVLAEKPVSKPGHDPCLKPKARRT